MIGKKVKGKQGEDKMFLLFSFHTWDSIYACFTFLRGRSKNCGLFISVFS